MKQEPTRYGIKKEAKGYSVWTLSPGYGDRKEWIADCVSRWHADKKADALNGKAYLRSLGARGVEK